MFRSVVRECSITTWLEKVAFPLIWVLIQILDHTIQVIEPKVYIVIGLDNTVTVSCAVPKRILS